MAILRAELPVREEVLMADGLIANRCLGRYTLLHGAGLGGELDSRYDSAGFSSILHSNGEDSAQLVIKPNRNIPKDDSKELIIRSVAATTFRATVQRFIIPNDIEFYPTTFEIGREKTVEVTYGLTPEEPVTALRYNQESKELELAEGLNMFYLKSVVWVHDMDRRVGRARMFYDAWAE